MDLKGDNIEKNNTKAKKNIFNKVLAIDFETANSNNNTACSIGFALLEDGEITVSEEILINPESHFSDKNIEIHNITPDMVKDKDIFPIVWKKITKLIDDNTLIIAHNTAADMTILRKLGAKYNLDIEKFSYLCTMEAYKKNGNCLKYGLKNIATDLGIEFKHHNAKEDALVCLKIFINLLEDKRYIRKDFIEKDLGIKIKEFASREEDKPFKRRFFKQNSFKASDITTSNIEFDESHEVYNKMFIITGDFVNIEKRDAAQRIVDLGGVYKDNFVKAVDYLIVGLNEYKEPSINTTKYNKAMEKLNKGGEIKIIDEEEFLNLVNWSSNSDSKNNGDAIVEEVNYSTSEEKVQNRKIESKKENVKEIVNKERNGSEPLGQLSFEFFMGSDSANKEKKVAITKERNTRYIEPKKQWTKFESIDEKLNKLKEYKLISPKATNADKKFYYKGLYSHKEEECLILGYFDEDVLVIEIKGNIHSIRGEYLKQMQDSKFNRFDDSIVEK